MKPGDLARVIIDTTVQPKNITFPTDAKLLNRAREKLVKLAQKQGMELRQSYSRVGKFTLIKRVMLMPASSAVRLLPTAGAAFLTTLIDGETLGAAGATDYKARRDH